MAAGLLSSVGGEPLSDHHHAPRRKGADLDQVGTR